MAFTEGPGVVWRMLCVPKDTEYPHSKRPDKDMSDYNFHFGLSGVDS